MNVHPNINLIYFNCNSILHKKVEIAMFLKNNDVDVIVLNETYLKSKHKFEISGYDLLRFDAPDDHHGGGTAIAHSR